MATRKRGSSAGTASKAQKAASKKVREKNRPTKTERAREKVLSKKGAKRTSVESTEMRRLQSKRLHATSTAGHVEAHKASSDVKKKQTATRKKSTQKARKATTARRNKK